MATRETFGLEQFLFALTKTSFRLNFSDALVAGHPVGLLELLQEGLVIQAMGHRIF